MKPVAAAAVRAGLVDDDMLRELRRWGFVPSTDGLVPYTSVEEAVEGIRDALESEDQVALKRTDLDLLRRYLNKDEQVKGRLVIIDPDTDERASKAVVFCTLPGRRYVLPWLGTHSPDLLVNGESYISYKVNGASMRAYFSSFEELCIGEVKAFIVLEASDVAGQQEQSSER